jgi:hypothetical protein
MTIIIRPAATEEADRLYDIWFSGEEGYGPRPAIDRKELRTGSDANVSLVEFGSPFITAILPASSWSKDAIVGDIEGEVALDRSGHHGVVVECGALSAGSRATSCAPPACSSEASTA